MSWFAFTWTESDKKLLRQWHENVGNVPVIDELSPDYIPYTDKNEWIPIPYVIERSEPVKKQTKVKEIRQSIIVPIEKKRKERLFSQKRTPVPKWKKESLVNVRGIQCEDCKGDFDQIHHVDGDPNNNESENLRLLCYRCHKKADRLLYWNGKARRRGKVMIT